MVIGAAARIGNCRSRPTDGVWSWPEGGEYRGFNDHHLMEKVTDAEGIQVSRETVRQVLRARGLRLPGSADPPDTTHGGSGGWRRG